MKKYITLATLLAAGSALANATDGITLRYEISEFGDGNPTNSASTPGNTSVVATGGYVNWVEMSDISGTTDKVANLTGNGHFSISGSSGINAGGNNVLSTENGFTLVFNGYATSNWADFLSFTIGNVQYKFETDNGESVHIYTPSGEGNNVNSVAYVSNIEKNTWYNYAISVSGTSYTYSAWDSAGNKISSTTFTGAEGALTDVYEGARFSEHWNYGSKIDNFGLYDGVLGDNELKALVKSEASGKGMVQAFIPEPSAFGLLAGLGALALVGTRRRNRR